MIRRTSTPPAATPQAHALTYREAFLETVTPEDVRAIGAALLKRAKTGDPAAARLVLDRVLGSKPVASWPTRKDTERTLMLDDY